MGPWRGALTRGPSQLLAPGGLVPGLGAHRAYQRDWCMDVSEGRYGGLNNLFRKLLMDMWKRTGGQ